jgi:GT2 family glycosyltransferase
VISVSIVSHGHGGMVSALVGQLLAMPAVGQLILTLNVPENLILPNDPRLIVVRNDSPKGFGANHNSAFLLCSQEFFCPLNPDISFSDDPFMVLLETAQSQPGKAIVVPLIRAPDGQLEDSARYFPTLTSLLFKLLGKYDGRFPFSGTEPVLPEWVAGMLMHFRRNDFAELAGFDEEFFLYYEDVDICVRAWKAGMRVVVCPGVCVVHAAQRDSHHSLQHMRWHINSIVRYFYKHWGRLPSVPRT